MSVFSPFIIAVVLQYYEVQVFYNKNVIRGNTAILKCTIPSFVRDYITVTSWVQDSTFNIYPSIKAGQRHGDIESNILRLYKGIIGLKRLLLQYNTQAIEPVKKKPEENNYG
ncbi:hypothetical protein J437_LFUL006805 [Ladona fulva]|uniref:Ig-like domain-containing protein n=1 Tax=Ladona fulva TaxID=123851 RepID=A0A8K0K4R4_LADFU|nr:hypothetical protein J437_LFUL006805 [Ladona fulva]